MSRVKRVVAIVLLVCICALVSLSFLVTTGPGERLIKTFAESRLESVLDRAVRIGTLETNLVSRLVLEDVSVFRTERGDTVPIIDIDGCRIGYDLRGLLTKHVRIHAIEVDRLSVSALRDSTGFLDLPAVGGAHAERDGSGGGFSVTVQRAVVRDARFRYRDEKTGRGAWLGHINIEVFRTDHETYDFHAVAGAGGASYDTVQVPVTAVRLDGAITANAVEIDSLVLGIPGLSCRGSGSVVTAAPSTIACDIRCSADLEHVSHFAVRSLPVAIAPVEGALELSLRIGGTTARWHAAVRGSIEDARIAGIDIVNGSFGVAADQDTIRLEELMLSLFGGSAACSGTIATDGSAGYWLQAALEGLSLERILRTVHGTEPPYRGRVYGELSARGSMRELQLSNVHASIRVRDVEYRTRPIDDFTVTLEQHPGGYEIRFDHEAGVIDASGILGRERLDGRFTISIIDMDPLAGLLGLPGLDGALRVSGRLGGSYRSPEAHADFSGGAITYRNFPVDTLSGGLHFRDNTLHLYDCTVRGSVAPIDTARPPFGVAGLSGRFSYAAGVSGSVPELRGDLAVELEEFAFRGTHIDRGALRVSYAERRVFLQASELRVDSVLVRATGAYDLSAGNGSVAIDMLRDGTGAGKGAALPIDPGDMVYRDETDHDLGRLSIDIAASPDSGYTVRLDGRHIDIASIRCFDQSLPDVGGTIDLGLDGGGTISDPRFSLGFSVRRPRFGRVGVDSLAGMVSFAGRSITVQELDIHDRGHRTRVTAALGLVDDGRGGFTVAPLSPFRGTLSGSDFDLALLDPILSPKIAVRGSGSFDVAWDGTLAQPHPTGSIVVGDGSIRMNDKAAAVHALDLSAEIADSLITVRAMTGYLGQTPFLVRGEFGIPGAGVAGYAGARRIVARIELDLGGSRALEGNGYIGVDSLSLNARIRGVDLSLFQPFAPELERLGGVVDGELKLYGSSPMPDVDGRLAIRGLSVYHAGLGQPVSDGVLVVTFDRRSMTVDTFAVRVGEGSVTASGALTHRGSDLESVDLRLEASGILIDVPKKIELRVLSANVSYRTEEANHVLDGDIVLGETRFIANFKPQSVISFTRSIEKPERELPPFLARTRLNVRLREGDDIWIDNNLARLRVHPELNIVGDPARPNISGRLTVMKGYVLFLDRKFNIKRGVVDFVDPDRLNPFVDIEASTTVKTYRAMEAKPYDVTLTVHGPLDEAVTTLVSDPPLERPDIVTLLTLGVTRTELTGTGETGESASVRGVLLERAQALTSQRVSSYVARSVGGLLGLDQISIEGNLFRFDDSWGPELIAAKRFSGRVEVTYRTNIGHLNEHNILLDYRLTRRFSLIGETDQFGRSGIDLKYGLKFK